jgi:hypothetical protein
MFLAFPRKALHHPFSIPDFEFPSRLSLISNRILLFIERSALSGGHEDVAS